MFKERRLGALIVAALFSAALICTAQPLDVSDGYLPATSGDGFIPSAGDEEQSSPEINDIGDYSEEDYFASGWPYPPSSKLRCSVWTDSDVYGSGDLINLYIKVNMPCYTKIVITKPDSTTTIIGPNWRNKKGTYMIPGVARRPFGTRDVALKAWTNTYPKKVCRSYTSYIIGFVGLFSANLVDSNFPAQDDNQENWRESGNEYGFNEADQEESGEFDNLVEGGDFEEPSD